MGSGVDLRVWGKSRGLACEQGAVVTYPLVCHLLDTAAFAAAVWDSYLSPGLRQWLACELGLSVQECRCFVMFLAGVHDVGKCCPGFQHLVEVPDDYPVDGQCADHAFAGHVWVGAALQHKFGVNSEIAVRVGEIVGGHHGIFSTLNNKEFVPKKMRSHGLGVGAWSQQRRSHMDAVREVVGFTQWPQQIARPAQVVLCAVVVLADWLASHEEFIRLRLPHVPNDGDVAALTEFFDGSFTHAPAQVVEAGLKPLRLKDGSFAEEFGMTPNRLQHSIEQHLPQAVHGPGLLIMTEQTGGGKTEAALYAARVLTKASGTAGLSLLLPTMATSNAAETRIAEYIQKRCVDTAPLNLLHSMAWLRRLKNETETADAVSSQASDMRTLVTEWLSGGKKAAFAPVSVGTIDQALLSVLPVKHNALRMLAFTNKTIVIDEIHAFDEYVYGLLSTFLEWCGRLRVPVVLMSATLPRHIVRKLTAAYLGKPAGSDHDIEIPYPGWCYVDLDSHQDTTHAVSVADDAHHHLAVELAECRATEQGMDRMPALRQYLSPLVSSHGSAAIVCTTVEEAQRTYTQLGAWLHAHDYDAELILVHARMPLQQRDSITDMVTSRFGRGGDRSGRTIVVSTQIVEQSLDIDMDLVITDLAPLELLLQRAGREQRHSENDQYRPAWAQDKKLIVLTPHTNHTLIVPNSWHMIYPEAAMIRTHRLLLRQGANTIQIPGQVQQLVDTVHTDPDLIAGHEKAEIESKADDSVKAHEAIRASIPRARHMDNIGTMSKGANIVDDDAVATRFNADSVRVLPCFSKDDALYLDPEHQHQVPAPSHKHGKPFWSRHELATIINHTVPLRATYVDTTEGVAAQPPEWHTHHLLKHLIPLVMHTNHDGQTQPATMRGNHWRLHPELGLIR